MKILAIDTSGKQASAAIVSEYITIGEILLNARTGEKSWTHSEILMPGIDQLFKLTRLEPQDIDYIVYTCGPGSFTGLRIGASVALGMAKSLKIQALPVPTLDALAYNAHKINKDCLVIPMLDARRGQVYTIDAGNEDGVAIAVEDFIGTVPEGHNLLFIGDGADANADLLRRSFPQALFAPLNNNSLRASSVGLWAAEKIAAGHKFSEKVELMYVREPQAVREKNGSKK